MAVDTLKDYITCLRLPIVSVSSGLVSLVTLLFCLLLSMVLDGFYSILLSAFFCWLLIGGLFGLQMASKPLLLKRGKI